MIDPSTSAQDKLGEGVLMSTLIESIAAHTTQVGSFHRPVTVSASL